MQIITLSPRGFGANTYVITKDGENAVIIDPSAPHIAQKLKTSQLTPTHVLLTHCHFDHVGGVKALQEMGAKVLCSAEEKPLVNTEVDLYGLFGAPRIPYEVDETFADGEEKTLSGIRVRMILTPGHTKGSACYLFEPDTERALFTGDTLFAGSIGRTDFPTGDLRALRDSLKRLAKLDGDYSVYPGHNDPTTLEQERKTNPFLRDA